MINVKNIPEDGVFWYLNGALNQSPRYLPLRESTKTDVVIIGGGMAGLSAAQSFHEKGLRVVVLEKSFCGAGATGKSSGFITPNSELALNDLIAAQGLTDAQKLWEFASSGVTMIRNNILTYDLSCDYQQQDTLVVASHKKDVQQILNPEVHARQQLGYPTQYYAAEHVSSLLGSSTYHGALTYPGSFSINPYLYCLGMKEILSGKGVRIYEDTPVMTIKDHCVTTADGYHVTADHIIVCVDRFAPDITPLQEQVYHVQTFIMLSEPLSDKQVGLLFPQKPYMTWDTALIYHYYRLTGDQRLILGGSTICSTYARQETYHNKRVMQHLQQYAKKTFPQLSFTFTHVWPGLIGVSKDLLPIAGPDKDNPFIYYISAATGLPWAAALGAYSAQHYLEKTDASCFGHHFSPYRDFTFGHYTQSLLGKRLTFALSHFLASSSF